MKKKISIIILTVLLPITTWAQNNSKKMEQMNTNKTLVTFFSRAGENYGVGYIEKGNTHIIAEMIADETGGDIFLIDPKIPYPKEYDKCTEIAKQELKAKARPEIKNDIDIKNYDIIFIGYPNWWGDMPMPVYTFIEKHNWLNKIIITFCTLEGIELSDTENKLKATCKGANVLKGLAIRGSVAQNSQMQARQDVKDWLKKIKLK